MDPTAALEQIREKTKAVESIRMTRRRSPSGRDADLATAGVELAEQFEDLDEWISRGGFLPEPWKPHIGKPRRTEDGEPVLEGVKHGTRASYNKGCRCLECTRANRDAGTRQRARRKERP